VLSVTPMRMACMPARDWENSRECFLTGDAPRLRVRQFIPVRIPRTNGSSEKPFNTEAVDVRFLAGP